MALGEELAKHLRGTGHFDAELSRQGESLVPYPDRVSSSEQWEAHVFLSLHSDVRGQMQVWDPDGGQQCPRSEVAPGFSVLWSDDGEQGTRRRTLARTLATNMARAGFLAYPGEEYELYEGDEVVPGVFVDRPSPGQEDLRAAQAEDAFGHRGDAQRLGPAGSPSVERSRCAPRVLPGRDRVARGVSLDA